MHACATMPLQLGHLGALVQPPSVFGWTPTPPRRLVQRFRNYQGLADPVAAGIISGSENASVIPWPTKEQDEKASIVKFLFQGNWR